MISSLMEAAGRQLRPQVAKVVGCNNEVLTARVSQTSLDCLLGI